MQKRLRSLGLGALVAGAMVAGPTFAQDVIISENMGLGTTTQSIEDNVFENDGVLTYSGNADTRISSASSGYTGASGGKNVFMTSGGTATNFTMAGIDTTGYTNITLTFGVRKGTTASDGTELTITYSDDGGPDTSVVFPALPTGTGTATWHLVTATTTLPESDNLSLTFAKPGGNPEIRLDDILIEGVLAGADFIATNTAASFGGVNVEDGPFEHDVTIDVTNPVEITPPSPLPANVTLSITGATNFAATGDITVTWDPPANDGSSINETLTFTTDGNPASFDVTVTGTTVEAVSIADARDRFEADSNDNGPFLLSGVVSSNNLNPSRNHVTIQDRTDGDIATRGIYIDDNGGSGIDGRALPEIGDTVTVLGTLSAFNGLVQLTPSAAYDIDDSSPASITPVSIDSSQLTSDRQGVVITISDAWVASGTDTTFVDGSSSTVTMEDSEGTFPMFARDSTGISMTLLGPTTYALSGVGNEFNNPQLSPRSGADIVDLDTTAPVTTLVADEELVVGTEVGFTYSVVEDSAVSGTLLLVRAPGGESFEAADAVFDNDTITYTAAASGLHEFVAISDDVSGNQEVLDEENAVAVVVNTSENAELTLDVETGTGVEVTFPMASGINVTITFADVTSAGTVSVERILGALNAASLGLDPDRLGGQVLVITAGGGLAFTTATIVFDIDEALLGSSLADLNAIDTVYVNRGGTLSSISGGDVSVDAGEGTVTVSGVDEFSEWYFGDTTSNVSDWMMLLD